MIVESLFNIIEVSASCPAIEAQGITIIGVKISAAIFTGWISGFIRGKASCQAPVIFKQGNIYPIAAHKVAQLF